MSNLLTFNQQIAIKPISSNNQSKFDQLCKEVERTDLKDLIGLALLQDLETNPTSANNLLLLNGTSFVNQHNQTVSHQGLRYVLAYLIHVRYIGESFVKDTFTGMVRGTQENSEPISEGSIKRLQNVSKEIALSEFQLIKEYLNLKYDLFPLWLYILSTKTYTPKFIGISKTDYNSNGNEGRNILNGKKYLNG